MNNAYLPLLVVISLAIGCNQGGFSGGGEKASTSKDNGKDADDAEDSGVDDKNAQNGGGGDPLGNPEGEAEGGDGNQNGNGGSGGDTQIDAKPDDQGLLIGDDGIACVKDVIPVHVMFAIDTTMSMDDEIKAVANNVAEFATALQSMPITGTEKTIPEVKVGAVAYVDDPSQNIVLDLQDASTFATQVKKLDTRGGINDHCEGGLQAAYKALQILSGSGDSFKVMVVISDNFSHDGGGSQGSRSFDATSLVDGVKYKSLKNLALFDSVPTHANVPDVTACNVPAGSPADQWSPVRAAWQTAHPKAKLEPGRNLGFPFAASTLSSVLPGEIAKLLRVCK